MVMQPPQDGTKCATEGCDNVVWEGIYCEDCLRKIKNKDKLPEYFP